MSAKVIVWVLMGLWVIAYGGSLLSLLITEPTGDGFTKGLNRVMTFLGWQVGASVLAIIIWSLGKHFEAGSRGRWACRLPVLLALGLVLVVIGIIAYAKFGHPQPQASPSPVQQETTIPLPDQS